MAPQAHLRGAVYYCLDNDMLDNALFLAGRLHQPDAEASHLLGLCNLRLGRFKAAYDSVKKFQHHLGCCYVFAQACLGLERFAEGAFAIEKARGQWAARNQWNKHTENTRRPVPDAAACYCLLGKLWSAQGDTKKAVDNYIEALKLNPFLWDAFTDLCDIGASVRPVNVFKVTPEMLSAISSSTSNGHESDPFAPREGSEAKCHSSASEADPFNPPTTRNGGGLNLGGSNLLSRLNEGLPAAASESPEVTEIPRPIGQYGHKRTVSGHSTHHAQVQIDPTAAPPRRSVRLLNSITQIRPGSSSRLAAATTRDPDLRERRELRHAKATGTKGTKSGTMSTVGRVVSGNRKPPVEISEHPSKPESRPTSAAAGAIPPPRMALPTTSDSNRDLDHLNSTLELLQKMGTGYAELRRYQCTKALEAFASIPAQQRESPWVLAQVGKAYYEMSRYADSEKYFQRLRDKAPSYLDDMEVYSNALWQLKKETDLSYLAHTLIDQDRLSPQAWCALGNAFSLQRDHDQAVKCFTRATQLDPKFAYAFTLQGHEHMANEELDKALFAFRCAVSADNRHFQGWFGLGQVFEKMAKFEVAEKHFRAAALINPTNPLLAVKIGVVLDKLKKTQPALAMFMEASRLDPKSSMARFRKAQAHLKLGQPAEALKDLELLKDVAPEDPNVHFLLGKTYKFLGKRAEAIRCFTIALNLDPKASQYIKENMERMDEDDDASWSSDGDR